MLKLVSIAKVPNVFMAHRYQTDKYNLAFQKIDNLLEISYIEEGEITRHYDDGSVLVCPAGAVSVNFYQQAMRWDSTAPVHRHITMGISSPMTIKDIDEETVRTRGVALTADGVTAIVPELTRNAAIVPRIRDAISAVITAHTAGDVMRQSGLALMILSYLSEAALSSSNAAPAAELYTARAVDYIQRNLHLPIQVNRIAAELGISYGYFSGIFRSVTGKTVVEYINHLKLSRVAELIAVKNISLAKAGEAVGIYDENYLCRLFKKEIGMTVSEFRSKKSMLIG